MFNACIVSFRWRRHAVPFGIEDTIDAEFKHRRPHRAKTPKSVGTVAQNLVDELGVRDHHDIGLPDPESVEQAKFLGPFAENRM